MVKLLRLFISAIQWFIQEEASWLGKYDFCKDESTRLTHGYVAGLMWKHDVH